MRRLLPILTIALLASGSVAANASQDPTACGCAPTTELKALRDRIAAAPDLASAQEMAVTPVEQARGVVAKLGWASPSLRDAAKRMEDYESRVRSAHAPGEVAAEFGSLVRLASADNVAADGVHTSGCNYSTGEIIAIVLGFFLAIIPGIILLILLC